MHITDSFTYAAGLEAIRRMSTNPEFVRSRLDFKEVESCDVNVEDHGDRTVVNTTVTINAAALPDAARRFAKKGLTATLTETWSSVMDGKCQVSMDLKVQGVPVTASALSTVTDQGDTTLRSVDADFHVKIPLVGKTVEQKAVGRVSKLWKSEVAAAQKWLAEHPQG